MPEPHVHQQHMHEAVQIYPSVWEPIGSVCHAMADCQMLREFKKGGVQCLERAYDCFRVLHGDDSPQVRLLKGKLLSSKATTKEEFEEAVRLLNMRS